MAGGEETRLTTAPGLDDGPDYAADGRIWFNSVRTGVMKIWRMDADGKNQTQMTRNEEYADWFPHPSPDGKRVVFLSYDRSVEGHPPDKDVVLRLMPLEGGEPRVVARLLGGQGTINVPSWSPDSSRFAFVSYRRSPTERPSARLVRERPHGSLVEMARLVLLVALLASRVAAPAAPAPPPPRHRRPSPTPSRRRCS